MNIKSAQPNNEQPSADSNFFKIISGFFLIIFACLNLAVLVLGILVKLQTPVSYPVTVNTASTDESAVYIADKKASSESVVSEKIVAEKVDLQRKMFKLKEGQDPAAVAALAEQAGAVIIKQEDDLVVARVPKETSQSLKEDLKTSGAIESLEVDYPTFLAADNPDWGVERIEAPEVWDTTSGQGLRIAVVDTGIDYSHPDLQARFAGGYDTVNEDSDPADDHGHGTHVSGIIAADLNEAGLAGVAPQASIYSLKALASDGTGYISDLVEAIDWAMEQDAAVINFSLGSSYDSSILESKINEAARQGIMLVAAAGNTNGGSVLYPAAYDSVISVSATDSSDNFASFSSVGAEIAAPGVSINSTVPGGGYASWSGTSMAAPHVTATVALMISNDQEDIRENLRNSAIDLGPAGTDSYFGHGLVHAKPAALGEDVLAPVVTFLEPEDGSEVSEEVNIEIKVQDESNLSKVSLKLDGDVVASLEGEELQDQDQFSYLWDTSGLAEQTYTFVAEAVDEYDNSGQAKIEAVVNHSLDTTPTPSPSVTTTPTPTQEEQEPGQKQNDKELPEQSQAGKERSDQTPAQEKSLDKKADEGAGGQENADSAQQESAKPLNSKQTADDTSQTEEGSVESENIPDTSNSTQRNPTPVNRKPESAGNSQGSSGRVKGVMTLNWWQIILSAFYGQ